MDPINFAELERRVLDEEARELSAFLAGTGEAPVIYRSHEGAVKAVPENEGPIEFVCSEESDDRAGDLVHADGWDLAAFKRNPVLPWSHDYRVAPIGRWQKVHVEGKQLLGLATFDRNDPFAAQIEAKYRAKFLNAVSVGFRPIEFAEREERKDANPFRRGYEFKRQELLEISAVSVPMHPRALRKGLALADSAPVWVFMPGDAPGQFKAVQPAVQPTERGAIGWARAHPDGTPRAAQDAPWDGPAEVAAASVDDLRVMSAWVDSADDENKAAYKLPHHRAAGEHAVVFRGVAGAIAALNGARGGVAIPDGDRRGAYAHLARHMRDDFETEPPELRSADEWDAWLKGVEAGLAVPCGRMHEMPTTTGSTGAITHITVTSLGGDTIPPAAEPVQPKRPPEGGQGGEAGMSAVVAALRRVRE
jgi:HK97 family phage prohead protease